MNLDDCIGLPYRSLLSSLGSAIVAIVREQPGDRLHHPADSILASMACESVLIGGATPDGWTYFSVQFGMTNDGNAYAWTAINALTIDDTIYYTYALFRLTAATYHDLHEQAIVQAQAREALDQYAHTLVQTAVLQAAWERRS